MFPPVHVADIARHADQEVTLHGWLHGRRSSGKLHFLQLPASAMATPWR